MIYEMVVLITWISVRSKEIKLSLFNACRDYKSDCYSCLSIIFALAMFAGFITVTFVC